MEELGMLNFYLSTSWSKSGFTNRFLSGLRSKEVFSSVSVFITDGIWNKWIERFTTSNSSTAVWEISLFTYDFFWSSIALIICAGVSNGKRHSLREHSESLTRSSSGINIFGESSPICCSLQLFGDYRVFVYDTHFIFIFYLIKMVVLKIFISV